MPTRSAIFPRADRRRGARGQLLVEAAIAFPLLLLVALGLLQFAIYAHAQNVVLAAAEEGARVAANESATEIQGEQRAREMVTAGLGRYAQSPTASAQFLPTGSTTPDRVQVKVTASLRSILPIPLGNGTLPLSAIASMTKEHFRGPPS